MTSKCFVLYLFFIGCVSSSAEAKLTDFRKVDPFVFRGSQPYTKADYQTLKKHHIQTILSLQMMPHNTWVEKVKSKKYGFNFINIPFSPLDLSMENLKLKIIQAVRVMDDPALQPVYVHCLIGRHRTSLAVGMYRIHVQNWPAEAAKEEMDRFNMTSSGVEYTFFKGMTRFFEMYKLPGSLDLNSYPFLPLELE